MKLIIAIVSIFLLSGCGTKFTGENVRELKYGMSPQDVHSQLNSSSSSHMPFLVKVGSTEYRYVIYSAEPPYPSLNLLFKNGKLTNSVFETPEAKEVQRLLRGEKLEFTEQKTDYNSKSNIRSEEIAFAPIAIVANIGQFKKDEILLNINLGSTEEEITNIIGQPDIVDNIEKTELFIYESGRFIGQVSYVFSFENSKLNSIIRISYGGDFNKEDFTLNRNKYIEIIQKEEYP
jgi:hypothetical protein